MPDDLGRETSLTPDQVRGRLYGNGTSQSFGYDPVSRLTSLTANLAGTTGDLTINSIGYNPAGGITALTRSNDAYAWTGAAAVNRPYTSNGLNQLTLSGTIVPTYDGRGNLTSAGTTAYAYSSENMLVSASGGTSAGLSYDPLGRLYQSSDGATVRRFQYAPGESGIYEPISEYDGAGWVQSHHGFGPGVDEPMFWWDIAGGGHMRPVHADERGSVVAASDASGNAFATNSYDEYGIPGSGNAGRFQYTGQAWLPELGMMAKTSTVWGTVRFRHTTRTASTQPLSAGSCKPTRSDMAMG